MKIKKVGFAAAVFAVSFSQLALAQKDAPNTQGEAPTAEFDALTLAHRVAQYGYTTQNPLCLVTAAQLLSTQPTQKFVPESSEKGKPSEKSTMTREKSGPVVELDVSKLIKDALSMSKDDPAIKAMTDKISVSRSRGPVGGARMGNTRVEGNSTDRYVVTFKGQERAQVALSGDGDTDLDLYIFDENNHLVMKDEDGTDDCYVSWTPKWSGKFTIQVKNRGNIYNAYTIVMN